MKKKLLGLLVAIMFLTIAANATTFTMACGNAGASAPTTGTPPFTPGISANANGCVAFTVPTGQTLSEVQLTFKNDWQLGFAGTDTLVFTYGITGFNIGSMASSVTGTGAGGSVSPVSTNQGTCSVSGDIVTCNDFVNVPAGGTFNALGITITAAWLTGGLDLSGSEGTTISAIYTYGPTVATPEPASMLMIGGGLIGLVLIGRRKWHA